ncbi:hypothetical protein BDF22DRAFT_775283 [Syncephalis plumigaleata]|nr:hypothetical protein BDF22DRAFT_775283 [Syncephalis plumigaleata]
MAGDLATINNSAKPSIAPPLPVNNNNSNVSTTGRPPLPPPPSADGDLANRPPPPPRRSTVPETPYQYSQTGNYRDFRDQGHAEDGHWNDVPTTVLASVRKRSGTLPLSGDDEKQNEPGVLSDTDLNPDQLATGIESILNECTAASTTLAPTLKRMLTDTERRMQEMLTRLRNDQIAPHVMAALSLFVQAIGKQDYIAANKVHLDLMQTNFDSEGRWLVGAKRLVEIVQAARNNSNNDSS